MEIPRAVEMVQSLSPRVVVPMHYSLPGLGTALHPLDGFLKEMGLRDLEPQPRLNITATSLPQELRVVILAPRA